MSSCKTYHEAPREAVSSQSLCRRQSSIEYQRGLDQAKFVEFWSATAEDYRNNPRALWRTVNSILNAPAQQSTPTFTANDFAQFFQSKVNKIRDSTATCPPPDIQYRSVPSLNSFAPVTESEIKHMLSNCPTKSSTLDPIPAWLIKRLPHLFAPIICHLCNQSMQAGIFPSSHKHAIVLPRIKKTKS